MAKTLDWINYLEARQINRKSGLKNSPGCNTEAKVIFNNISRHRWRGFLTHLVAVPEKRMETMADKHYLI